MRPRERDAVLRTALWAALPAALWFLCLGRLDAFGLDSAHAYWAVWRAGPYLLPPGSPDAFTYSPVVAQVLWPLTLLPWPAFLAVWSAALAGALGWLLWPLPARWRWLVLLYVVPPAVVIGNVEAFLAVAAVVGLRRARAGAWAAAWALPLLTKVTPGLGPLWFLVRREWRLVGVSLGATAALVAASWAHDPHLWAQWVGYLTSVPVPPTQAHYPPLWVRLPAALALTAWAAHRSRPGVLVVAMVLAMPLWSSGVLLLLAALPRARRVPLPEAGADGRRAPSPGALPAVARVVRRSAPRHRA